MQKYYVMAIKQHLQKNVLNLFRTVRSTKHFVDRLLTDYNGYYDTRIR